MTQTANLRRALGGLILTTAVLLPACANNAPARSSSPSASSGSTHRYSTSGLSDASLKRLRSCESDGDYTAVSRTGTYRGAYQFSRSTWNSVAAEYYPHLKGVDPAKASPSAQDAMARALFRVQGWRAWPHCGKFLA